jgi:DNA polymerase I
VNDLYSKVPQDQLAKYAAMDVCITWRLWGQLKSMLQGRGLLERPFMELYMPANEMFTQMELDGMHIDIEYLEGARAKLEIRMDELLEQVRALAGDPDLNLNSPIQLARVLYDEIGLRPPTIRGLSPRTTNREALRMLAGQHPIIEALAEYRTASKMHSAYILNLMERTTLQGKIHASFYLHGTETGRISVRDPALQTIPRESKNEWGRLIRGSFVAPPGHKLVIADYSQAELRVFAALSGEPFLIEAYANERDLHSEMAKAIFGEGYTKEERNLTKMCNFAYIYSPGGANIGAVQQSSDRGKLNMTMVANFLRRYDENMAVSLRWKQTQFEEALARGFVSSRTGRRRRFPVINRNDRTAMQDMRKAAMNAPVQGLASDLTTISAMRMRAEGIKAVMVVHDSVICEVPDDRVEWAKGRVSQILCEVGVQYCPEVKWKADADVMTRWGAKE